MTAFWQAKVYKVIYVYHKLNDKRMCMHIEHHFS